MADKKYPLLPEELRERIRELLSNGLNTNNILNQVREEARPHIGNDETQLKHCIRGIKANKTRSSKLKEDQPQYKDLGKSMKHNSVEPMRNPFTLSDDNLKTLLDAFTKWYKNNPAENEYAIKKKKNAENIRSKLLNKSYLKNTPAETLINDILAYSRTLEGPAYIKIGETKVKAELDKIKRNLLYLIDSNEDPIIKAARILEGDYSISIFAKAFWTPIFQAQYPEILPNWNNKSEKFLKKVGINLHTSKLSGKEKYKLISDAFIYLNMLDQKQTFYHINHLMHYGTEIEEGVKLISELTGDIEGDLTPLGNLTQQIEKWRNEHVSEKRLAIRDEAYQEARAMLEAKAGKFNERELREFFHVINRDYWNEKIQHARFQMAYVGKNINELVDQITSVNSWVSFLWKTPENELKDLIDKFYKEKPLKNAGTAFPSLILFHRDQSKYNLCFKRMEAGFKTLTSFQKKGYSGEYYLTYNDKVNDFKAEHSLLPQEIDIILCLPKDPTSYEDEDEEELNRPFSKKAFDLLQGLHENPTREYYSQNKNDFKEHIEEPFQNIFQKVASKFGEQITRQLETNKKLFSRILKNDYGKGGAWDFYWGAFYPKGGKRVEDAQLYLSINHEILEYGFSIGVYGGVQSKRFLYNCRSYKKSLEKILSESISDERFIYGNWDKKLDKGHIPSDINKISLSEWLKNPSEKGINVSDILTEKEVLRLSQKELVHKITSAFLTLFPLFILTVSEEPISDINEYLGGTEPTEPQPPHPLNQVVKETGFQLEQLKRWVAAIERKGQAILYGPPGTGKTFMAEQLARHLISEGDGFYDILQFHPAYAYEDFIQGIRPKAGEDGQLDYPTVPGRFLEFCKKARRCKDRCVLIIDEINRANLARVFGELMYLLEYRDRNVPLAGGGLLHISKNVRIIGTMNTADRSIALVDHALRRRFAFLSLYPNYTILKDFHEMTKFNAGPLINILEKLNRQIGDRHYEVGISFFLKEDLSEHIEDIWRMEIEPYLEEYFFDQPDKTDEFRWEKIGKDILP